MAPPLAKSIWPAVPTGLATIVAVVETTPLTIALVGLVSAVAVAIVAYRQSVNHEHIAGTDRLVDHLQEQLTAEMDRSSADRALIDQQRSEMFDLQKRMLNLELGARRLAHQLETLGHVPVWHPDAPLHHHTEETTP